MIRRIRFRDAVLGKMDKQHVDALVYPTWSKSAAEGWRCEESGGGQQPDTFAAARVSGDFGADGIYA
jgi:hypothetical protein